MQKVSPVMKAQNQTIIFLVGFKFVPWIERSLFVIFLLLYVLSLVGNLAIISAIWLNKCLQSPMYYFLRSLAFLDISFISSTIPKLLTILATNNGAIPLSACVLQFYVYVSLGATEFYLLAAMSVDRYVAVCQPLRYHSIITIKTCNWTVLVSWVGGFLTCTYPALLMGRMSFCGPYEINHFVCDSSAVVKISCSNYMHFNMVFSSTATAVILGTFIITFISYLKIIITIMKIRSAGGRKKSFSTCTSHFTVVFLGYGSAIFIYIRPTDKSSFDHDKAVAILNSIMIPLLNPIIYSLRNKQVKVVFRKMWINSYSLVIIKLKNTFKKMY